MKELELLRSELDAVDKGLEEGFARRMQIVGEIAEYKAAHALPTLDAAREAEVLEKHTQNCPAELKPYMAYYFKVLMSLSRNYQELLAVECGSRKQSEES